VKLCPICGLKNEDDACIYINQYIIIMHNLYPPLHFNRDKNMQSSATHPPEDSQESYQQLPDESKNAVVAVDPEEANLIHAEESKHSHSASQGYNEPQVPIAEIHLPNYEIALRRLKMINDALALIKKARFKQELVIWLPFIICLAAPGYLLGTGIKYNLEFKETGPCDPCNGNGTVEFIFTGFTAIAAGLVLAFLHCLKKCGCSDSWLSNKDSKLLHRYFRQLNIDWYTTDELHDLQYRLEYEKDRIEKSPEFKITQSKAAIMMGAHDRLGSRSALHSFFHNEALYDQNLTKMIFEMAFDPRRPTRNR
jgi:hypothetical protein